MTKIGIGTGPPHRAPLFCGLLFVVCWALCTACPPPQKGSASGSPSRQDLPRAQKARDIGISPSPDYAFIHCAEADPSVRVRPLRLGGLWLRPQGQRLRPVATAKDAKRWARPRLILGVVASPRAPLKGTLKNLAHVRKRFMGAKVDAIIALGGFGDDRRSLSRLLRGIMDAEAKVSPPILLIPGDQLPMPALRAELTRWSHRVHNLAQVRSIHYPGFVLWSLPGMNSPHHLVAGTKGCAYGPQDVTALGRQIQLDKPGSGVLLAYVAPAGRGTAAIDRSVNGSHLGDAHIAALIKARGIRFGIFASVPESGGRAVSAAGKKIPAGTWSKSLFVNAGSIDSVPLQMTDGGWSRGLAVIVEIQAHRARFSIVQPRPAPLRDLAPLAPPKVPRRAHASPADSRP